MPQGTHDIRSREEGAAATWHSPKPHWRRPKVHGATYPQASCASASAFGDQLNHNVIFITSGLTHSTSSLTRTRGTSRSRPRRGLRPEPEPGPTRLDFRARACAFSVLVLVLGPPASAAPGWNNSGSDAGGLACEAVGSTLEEDIDGATAPANCVVVSWTAGAGCAPPNWTGPTEGFVAQAGHGPVA